MDERDLRKLVVLDILRPGRTRYADAQAVYERRAGVAGGPAAEAFADLVRELIADKLIDYEAGPAAPGPVPAITALWLRAKGRARLDASDPQP